MISGPDMSKHEATLRVIVLILLSLWAGLMLYRLISPPNEPDGVVKAGYISILNDSAIEMWHVTRQDMSCMVAIHIYPKLAGSPAQMHLDCRR